MQQAPQAPPPQQYQPYPQPPTQQSSIQIPVGSALPKVVSTACIYPSQPGEITCGQLVAPGGAHNLSHNTL